MKISQLYLLCMNLSKNLVLSLQRVLYLLQMSTAMRFLLWNAQDVPSVLPIISQSPIMFTAAFLITALETAKANE